MTPYSERRSNQNLIAGRVSHVRINVLFRNDRNEDVTFGGSQTRTRAGRARAETLAAMLKELPTVAT